MVRGQAKGGELVGVFDEVVVEVVPLASVITDSHFAARDRMGRLLAFTARAMVGGIDYGEGIGRTKKEAEQHAAAAAYQALEASPEVDPDADAVSNA